MTPEVLGCGVAFVAGLGLMCAPSWIEARFRAHAPPRRAADLRDALRRFPDAIAFNRTARVQGARWSCVLDADGVPIVGHGGSPDAAGQEALELWRKQKRVNLSLQARARDK